MPAATTAGDPAQCPLDLPPASPRSDAGPPSTELDCLLRADWSRVEVTGLPGCSAFSAVLEAPWFRWDGSRLEALVLDSTPLAARGSRLERMRLCARDVGGASELWRFEEHFELAAPLAAGACPSGPITARYEYSESGELAGAGVVFAAGLDAACRFDACVRLVPASTPVPAPVGASPEAQCAPAFAGDPTRPTPIGSPCRSSTECEASSFCSLERPDGTCAFIGDGTCRAAPLACSPEPERICSCYGSPPLVDTNRCLQNAQGNSTATCPSGSASAGPGF